MRSATTSGPKGHREAVAFPGMPAPPGEAALSEPLQLNAGETVVLRLGAGFFPRRAMGSHGGRLYLTSQRVAFRPFKVDRALTRSDSSFDVPLSDIVAIGSTPKWGPPPARSFLRIDTLERSYLLLIAITHWRGRTRFIESASIAAPNARVIDGWGRYDE